MATSIDYNAADGKSGKSYGWLLIIRCTRTAIRSGAGSTYSVLQYAYKGELYKKIGESGNWIKIKYGTKYGYLNKSYLKKK